MKPNPARRPKLIAGLDLAAMRGLEIGPLDRPIVTKADGDIRYVDQLPADALRHKYRDDAEVYLDRIVPIDIVWGEVRLAEAVGARAPNWAPFDYIVASHVAEHVPDLAGWLEELREVLAPSGSVRLALPDRRFTFDHLRRESTLAELAAAALLRPRRPPPVAVLDCCLNAVTVDPIAAWSGQLAGAELVRRVRWDDAMAMARDAIDNGTYHDVHCWVFTPTSFAQLMQTAASRGLIAFACAGMRDTEPDDTEFFVTLVPSNDAAQAAATWGAALDGLRSPLNATDLASVRRRFDEERDAFEADRARLTIQRDWLRHRVAALEASSSWRLTAPLRAVARRFRGG